MTVINPADLSRRERYQLMVSSVMPRPIGWISTMNEAGDANLAPFSFFNAVTSEPPTLMISVGRRRDGTRKDSAANLLATQEAVVHIAHRDLAEKMVATSAEVAPEVDEFGLADLERVPSDLVRPFRVKDALIAMEATMARHLEVGVGPVDMFLLEVVRFHLGEEIVADGFPDPTRLEAVGRLGGVYYCATTHLFKLARPPMPDRSGSKPSVR